MHLLCVYVCTYKHIYVHIHTYMFIYWDARVGVCVCVHVEAEVHAPVTFTAVIHLLSETPLLLSVKTRSVYGSGWSSNCYMVQV